MRRGRLLFGIGADKCCKSKGCKSVPGLGERARGEAPGGVRRDGQSLFGVIVLGRREIAASPESTIRIPPRLLSALISGQNGRMITAFSHTADILDGRGTKLVNL